MRRLAIAAAIVGVGLLAPPAHAETDHYRWTMRLSERELVQWKTPSIRRLAVFQFTAYVNGREMACSPFALRGLCIRQGVYFQWLAKSGRAPMRFEAISTRRSVRFTLKLTVVQ